MITIDEEQALVIMQELRRLQDQVMRLIEITARIADRITKLEERR